MLFEITRDYTRIIHEQDGVRREKLVDLSDLLDELSTYRSTNFGLLPRNTRYIECSGNKVVIAIEFEKRTRNLTYSGDGDVRTFENCSLPAGIIYIHLVKESGGTFRHVNTFLFALRGNRVIFDTDKLYAYPVPNIHNDGRVCWGRVQLGNVDYLSAAEGILSSFFSNNFNDDLFYDRLSTNCTFNRRGSAVDFFEFLTQNEVFEDEWLLETQYTAKQMVNTLLRG